jgi:hypothetical protein
MLEGRGPVLTDGRRGRGCGWTAGAGLGRSETSWVREALLVEGAFAGELEPVGDLAGELVVETVTRGLRPLLAAIQSLHNGSLHCNCTTFFFGFVDAARCGGLLEVCGCCASLAPLAAGCCDAIFAGRPSMESALAAVAWVRLE